jgi:para-nitrobenzyl esterase
MKWVRAVAILLCSCSAAATNTVAPPGGEADEGSHVVVATTAGRLAGRVDNGVVAFLGVPYGADTSTRRFQPPLAAPAWQGTRSATRFAAVAPQDTERGEAAGQSWSEDCLYLNVWTPRPARSDRRPVLVYFHGGGYAHGTVTTPLYDGAKLARRGDVVVVTVNHRLNAFGHLYLAELADARFRDSGNVGMLDLLLALHWVRDNIAAFGGDPGRVTLFGQSGGGAKIATLMAMPAARGLFHRAWTMSGQQISGREAARGTATAREVMAALGLGEGDVEQLLSLPAARLVEAMRGRSWTPVVDGGVLPRDPFAPDAPPQSAALPMVLGNTRDETTSLIGVADPALFELRMDDLAGKLQQHVAPFLGNLGAESVVTRYREWYPRRSAAQLFFAASTAARSWKGMVLASERRAAQGGPTWVYYVHWQSPLDGGRWGAPHTVDIPLLFGNLERSAFTRDADPEAGRLSGQMADALIAFARSGDPNAAGAPAWPRFRLPRRAAMIFDLQLSVRDDPRGAERRLFAPVPYVQPGTRD